MRDTITVLYIEDDLSISEEVVFFLTKKVKTVHVAYDGKEGLSLFRKFKPDIIVTDIEMPELNGLEMIKLIKGENKITPIIVTSAFSETNKLIKAIELGVDSYLIKPMNLKVLFEKIESLTKTVFLEKELEKMKELEAREKELVLYKESKEKELKFERLLELSAGISAMAFWELDLKKGIFTFNDLYYKFLATDAENENGYFMDVVTYLEAFIPPSGQQVFMDVLSETQTKSSDYSHSFEYQMIRRDGVVLDVLVDCYFTYDSEGQVDKSYGTKYNLGKQKEKEKELREAKDKSEKLLDEQNVLLSLFDKGESVLFKWKNDEKWNIEYVSKNVERLIPDSLARFNSALESYDNYIHKDDINRVLDEVKVAIEEGKDSFNHHPYRLVTADNVTKWVIDNTVTQKDSDGNITHFIGSVTDITDKKITDKKIEDYLTLIDEHIVTTSTDLNGTITKVSKAFCQLSGYEKDELIGKTHSLFRQENTKESVYKDLWETIVDNKIYMGELKNIKKDGSSFWVNVIILPIIDEENIKTGYLSIKQDITDKKIIEELSITDDLTKLYNRRHFNKVFEREIARAKRDKKCIVFMMLDIDSFKFYNDTYGHQNGDNALIEIAKVLQRFTNRGGDYAFRLGGEEFGIILTSDEREKTKLHAISLIETIEALNILHENNSASKYVTASLGVVFREHDSDLNVNELYKIADNMLYKAKEDGRNQVVFY